MAGPASPGTEGPTYAPPSLPAGWIAQWDGSSRKYYFVQLATGVSQWEVPTQPVQTGNTPANNGDPYAPPGSRPGQNGTGELITHPDGSQTVKHPDGTMEPIMGDGTRGGPGGPTGDRGMGSMALNALLGGKDHGKSSSPLGGLANQFLGSGHGSSNHGGGGMGGKLVGKLASNLFSPSGKPEQPQNYHGGQTSSQQQQNHGIAGSLMGGVASMFGGKPGHDGGQNYGYSNSGSSGAGYSGQAPTYNPPGGSSGSTSYGQHGGSGANVASGGASGMTDHNSYASPSHSNHSYPPPPPGGPPHDQSSHGGYGQGSGYPNQQPSYGGQPPPGQYPPPPGPGGYGQPYQGGPAGHAPYGGQPSYGGGPPGGYGGRY